MPLRAQATGVPTRCAALSGQGTLPLPPVGYVSIVEPVVTPACTVSQGPVEIVPANSPLITSGAAPVTQNPSVFESAGGGTRDALASQTATVHERSWDCCGVDMNELDTTLTWQYNGSTVQSSSTHDAVSYHTETTCFPNSKDGWYLIGQTDKYISGGVGQVGVGVQGKAAFGYNGFFNDCLNAGYVNTYTENMYGYYDGSYYCTYSYTWSASFPGWHSQDWCGYGS
jgi:hypothetical protein